ncbi:CHAD domain-containing protein [Phytomonospora endophytica]|uniref:CHAD domain-containing protein n=1 Tax=Phytomonospora endophytica TaxID=714109 RepID=A0A841FBL3_9ACTN|nr:CHAD domain-containing protein [Phytomonospora endophytica]GIG64838.1 CHAD domain-containing protein [Phytomonospora endophytica]
MADADTARTVETERKYDVDPGFATPDLAGVATVGEPRTFTLRAVYHDTHDLRLQAGGLTFRRREGGPDAGWHLKLPAAKDTRVELHAPLDSAATPPGELAGLLFAHTRGRPLEPVATLTTVRTVRPLLDGGGRVLAELADDDVRAERADGQAAHWREVEVELVHGPPEILKTVGKRLRAAGAERASSASKLARALGDAVPAPTRPGGHEGTAGAAVTAYLARQLAAILTHDPLARRAEFDAVHRMRVAVRRIRSTLKSYRSVIDRERTTELRAELRWLAGELGTVRDLEVLRMRFTARLATLDARLARPNAWLADIDRREAEAYRALNTTLSGRRYLTILNGLDAIVTVPPFTKRAGHDDARELRRRTRRAWRKFAGAYESASTDEARHDARKLAKQARYAAEAARPVLGAPATDMARDAEKMQEALGGFQDGQIAMADLREALTGVTDPSEAFTLGVLYGIERREAYAALDGVAAVWASITPHAKTTKARSRSGGSLPLGSLRAAASTSSTAVSSTDSSPSRTVNVPSEPLTSTAGATS